MTFLPIVERELRIASRRRFTFWGRVGAAAFALIIFACLQTIAELSRGMGFKAGAVQFAVLKWISFLFACSAGLFFTSDTLSEEKREGTLGLLFLTDLRGYDVALGKLISSSLQAFYGLLAAIPIMGLTILAGGVAGREFSETLLVICNTLFLSLSIGLFVSSISRDVLKSINACLFAGLLIFAGLPLADYCLAGWEPTKFTPILSDASPGYLFVRTGAAPFMDYWFCLGIQHALAWMFLALSCVCTPRGWQEKASAQSSGRVSLGQRWRFGSGRGRLRFRRRLFEREPLLWLGLRDRWLSRLMWIVMGIVGIIFTVAFATTDDWGSLNILAQVENLLCFGLLIWIAAQASRFFIDGIRTGALELILVAPVGPERVVRSQWAALWRTFFMPVILLVILGTAGHVSEIMAFRHNLPKGAAFSNYSNYYGMQIFNGAMGIVKLAGNMAAVAWFSMWMGVTTRKVSAAIFKTFIFVLVLPSMALWFMFFVVMFTLSFSMASSGRIVWAGMLPYWVSSVVFVILHVAKNAFIIFWARRRLFTRFREAMMREQRIPIVPTLPPPVPPAAPPPVFRPPPIAPAGMGMA